MEISGDDRNQLLQTLKSRFDKHPLRHNGVPWSVVESRLIEHPEKLWSLNEMERTGGEPDVVGQHEASGSILFFDCAPESPKGRRSLCYDRQAHEARKEFKPESTAIDIATEMGIELLSEDQYAWLQTLGEFDLKTSSWLLTPPSVRKLGGAIFGDRRYDRVFVFHNGADSYYASRGFRGCLKV